MNTLNVTLQIKPILTKYNISAYRLAKDTGMSPNTVKKLLDNENPPSGIKFETLTKVISFLKGATKDDAINIEDIMKLN